MSLPLINVDKLSKYITDTNNFFFSIRRVVELSYRSLSFVNNNYCVALSFVNLL